jgi:hypothetical protein
MAEQAPAQPIPEEVAKRGYQGNENPGRPTNLMQVQTKPAGQGQGAAPAAAPEQSESPAAPAGSGQGSADS